MVGACALLQRPGARGVWAVDNSAKETVAVFTIAVVAIVAVVVILHARVGCVLVGAAAEVRPEVEMAGHKH